MDLTDIKALIKTMAISDLSEMEVSENGWTLRLSRHATGPAISSTVAPRTRPNPVTAPATSADLHAPLSGEILCLGSRSTQLRGAFGGHEGRALRLGDRPRAGMADVRVSTEFGAMPPALALPLECDGLPAIRVLPSAEYARYTEASHAAFWGEPRGAEPSSTTLIPRLAKRDPWYESLFARRRPPTRRTYRNSVVAEESRSPSFGITTSPRKCWR